MKTVETGMPALSIQQPWAWLIIHAGKDIENRSWRTNFRGRILVHAGKSLDSQSLDEVGQIIHDGQIIPENLKPLPLAHELECGGVVGSVDIVDCVTTSASPWFCGPYGFVLANPKPLRFIPCRGRLGIFNVLEKCHE